MAATPKHTAKIDPTAKVPVINEETGDHLFQLRDSIRTRNLQVTVSPGDDRTLTRGQTTWLPPASAKKLFRWVEEVLVDPPTPAPEPAA